MKILSVVKLLLTTLLSLTLLCFFDSCSKKDDTKPSLDNVSVSFVQPNYVVDLPDGLTLSVDPLAKFSKEIITSVNNITSYFYSMTPSSNATKSATSKAVTDDIPNATKNFLTYTWNDTKHNLDLAYQITETTDGYVFESFIKLQDHDDWLKYVYGEEKKDRHKGSLVVFDISGILGTNKTAKLIEYTWSRDADVLTFNSNGNYVKESDHKIMINLNQTLVFNEKTKAGNFVSLTDNKKNIKITWDTKGNGALTTFVNEKTYYGSWKI